MARSSGSSRRATRKRSQSGSGSSSRRSSSGRSSRGQTRTGSRRHSSGRARIASGGTSRRLTNVTTDHDTIRRWAEQRGALPACVQGTGDKGDIGMIRLEFPGTPNARDSRLQDISWEDWFRKFDESGLALLYEETTAGGQKSNFNKLVKRETAKGKTKAARA